MFANLESVLSRAVRELDVQRVEAEIHSLLENSVAHEAGAEELPETPSGVLAGESNTGPGDDAA